MVALILKHRLHGIRPAERIVFEETMDHEVRVPADGAREVGVEREGEAKMTDVIGAVLRLGHRTKRSLLDDRLLRGVLDRFQESVQSLRIHYPFQAAGLVSWVDAAETNPRTGRPFQRPERVAPLAAAAAPAGTRLDATLDGESASPGLVNPYAGSLGLGGVYVLGRQVRPYRRVLSATAAFRREVFL